MSRRVLFILFLLFSFGALLFWRPFVDDREQGTQQRPASLKPDFTARGLVTRLYQPDGKLAHRIDADAMKHYSPIGLTELERPVYIVYAKDGQATWRVSADIGTYYDDKTLILERNVNIVDMDDSSVLDNIVTSYLVVDMVAESMTTDHPVTITGKRFQARGEGMVADLYAEQVELKRHAETIYYQSN